MDTAAVAKISTTAAIVPYIQTVTAQPSSMPASVPRGWGKARIGPMTALERQMKLYRILMAIDLEIKQAAMLADCQTLDFETRRWSAVQVDVWRRVRSRVPAVPPLAKNAAADYFNS